MKRLAVFLVLVSLLLTACSSAPAPDSESASPVAITAAAEGKRYESPNGEYVAVTNGESFYNCVVITSTRGQSAEIRQMKWIRFIGWTANSRYAIINYCDQHGNRFAVGFDTDTWSQFFVAPSYQPSDMCLGDLTSACALGAVAIAPSSSRVLLEAGIVVDLENSTESYVLSGLSEGAVALAAWSPDEKRLAFVAYPNKPPRSSEANLYVVDDDLTWSEQIASVELCFQESCSLSWATDGQKIVLRSRGGRQTFEIGDE